MSQKKAVILWRGDNGRPPSNFSKSIISDVTSQSALTTLLAAIGSHSLCNVAKTSYNEVTGIQFAPPGADANVDRRAIYYFQDTITMEIGHLEIPAPPDDDVEQLPEGERIIAATQTALATALNTATGHAYVPLWAKVVQHG